MDKQRNSENKIRLKQKANVIKKTTGRPPADVAPTFRIKIRKKR